MVLKQFKDMIEEGFVWEWCKNVWYWNREAEKEDSTGFENDVKTYGTETEGIFSTLKELFENDVKTYGTETQTMK